MRITITSANSRSVANCDSCVGPVPERYTTNHGQVWSTTILLSLTKKNGVWKGLD